MATTSLWRVRGYIGKVLLYAENQRLCKLPLWMSLEQLFMTKMVNLKLKA